MDISPVKGVKAPKYPMKEEVSADLLKAKPPQRWAVSAAARIALGTLAAMSLTGCAPEPPLAGVPMPPETVTEGTAGCDTTQPKQTPMIEEPAIGEPAAPTINVAPLFLHGEGTGAFGCVMIAPPAFLSEEEALSVINAAAAEYGLNFTIGGTPTFTNVVQPAIDMYNSDVPKPPDVYTTFSPDFTDAAHGISIEYVSTSDVRDCNYGEETVSAGSYETADVAAQLSEALEGAVTDSLGHSVGVLYDPCADAGTEKPDDMSSHPSEDSIQLAKEQLHAQAKDFFEWLKSQGVI